MNVFMLEIPHFKKSYPSGFQLKFDSLFLDKGIHLVIGENGAGKTTLFKAIAGINSFEGIIMLDGLAIKKDPLNYLRFVNYSEAEPQYPEFLTLEELILFVAKAKKATKEQIEFLKHEFGVGSYSNNPISSYSSGMLKKASLLLAFLGNPKLIILDEPFTTIDAGAHKKLIKLIKSESAKGVSFMISSHHVASEDLLTFNAILKISRGTIMDIQ